MNQYTKRFLKLHFFEILLSVPKTIWINMKLFSLGQAIKMPIIISHYVRLEGINRRSFVIESDSVTTAMLRIGFGDSPSGIRENRRGLLCVKNGGKILLKGSAGLSQGIVMIADNAQIILGKHFRCNYSTTIEAKDANVVIGEEVVLGWKDTIKNNDGHYMLYNGEKKTASGDIVIGKHVWICSDVTISKNVIIGSDSVVAGQSLVTKAFDCTNVLLAGIPAAIVKRNINWQE